MFSLSHSRLFLSLHSPVLHFISLRHNHLQISKLPTSHSSLSTPPPIPSPPRTLHTPEPPSPSPTTPLPCSPPSLPSLHSRQSSHRLLPLLFLVLLFAREDSSLPSCPCYHHTAPMHEVSEGDDGRFPDRIVVTSQTTWQAAMSAVSVGLSFCTLPCSLVQPPPKSVNNNLVHPSSSVGVVLAMSEGQAAIDCGVVGEIDEKRQQASSPTASTCGC